MTFDMIMAERVVELSVLICSGLAFLFQINHTVKDLKNRDMEKSKVILKLEKKIDDLKDYTIEQFGELKISIASINTKLASIK